MGAAIPGPPPAGPLLRQDLEAAAGRCGLRGRCAGRAVPGHAGLTEPLSLLLLQRQRQHRRRLLQPPEDQPLPRRTDPGIRARGGRGRAPGRHERRDRPARCEPVRARLRQPCLRPRKQDVARPPAAPRPHAGRFLHLPRPQARCRQRAGGAHRRPRFPEHAGIRQGGEGRRRPRERGCAGGGAERGAGGQVWPREAGDRAVGAELPPRLRRHRQAGRGARRGREHGGGLPACAGRRGRGVHTQPVRGERHRHHAHGRTDAPRLAPRTVGRPGGGDQAELVFQQRR